jgi:Fe2+ transport system protein FeoA
MNVGRRQRHSEARSGTLEGQPVGAVLRLAGVDGGPQRTMRLLGLGLRAGTTVVVTHVRGRGVVVASDTGRVAIGQEMAHHIRVEEVG